MGAFDSMVYRQLRRFWRVKSRMIGAILNPLIWLIFFGIGWSNVFNNPSSRQIFGGYDYITFMAPGLMMMGLFSSSFISGVTVIWDKQFGFLKETLVAPTSRKSIISGRIIGDTLTALFQGIVILLFTFPLANGLKFSGIIPTLFIGFLVSVAIASFGVSLSLKMSSQEGFQMIMMMIMLPFIFLSGAIYPIKAMPSWMQYLSYINPLSYGVDAARYFLLGFSNYSIFVDISLLIFISVSLLTLAMHLFERTTID